MSRRRQPLEARTEGRFKVVRFRHPVRGRTVRVALGEIGSPIVEPTLQWLNKIFTNPEHWHALPEDTPAHVRALWGGAPGPRAKYGDYVEPSQPDDVKSLRAALLLRDVIIEKLRGQVDEAETRVFQLLEENDSLRGAKRARGPVPTLCEAAAVWLSRYTGRDPDHTKNVGYDIERFITHFGKGKPVTSLRGREADVEGWLRGLRKEARSQKPEARGNGTEPKELVPVSATRRRMIRWYVLKFLGESGLTLDKQRVAAVRKDEVRAQRAPIRWLTKAQAVQVARKLAQPWKDLFRVQMGLALRPSELVTLKRGDFDPHCRRVTLSPLGVFTLKEGSRTIRVPVPTRRVLQRRLKAGEIVFPCGSLHVFYRSFRTALRAAAVAAGVLTPMDCRIARRTATTLLLADGVPLKTVADITGDDVGTLMEHYAGVVPGGVLATAAAI